MFVGVFDWAYSDQMYSRALWPYRRDGRVEVLGETEFVEVGTAVLHDGTRAHIEPHPRSARFDNRPVYGTSYPLHTEDERGGIQFECENPAWVNCFRA